MRRPLQPAFRALAGALLLAMAALGAGAQERAPIRLVVPYPAGGAADQITRLVATAAARHLGAPIVIDNKGGAAGMIAGVALALLLHVTAAVAALTAAYQLAERVVSRSSE